MSRKHLFIAVAATALVGLASFAAGHAASATSPARLLARTPDEWTALAAWLALLVASGAACIAWVQVGEARRIRIEQGQPQVAAYLEQDPDIPEAVEIVIGNFGTTAATDVSVRASVPVRGTSGAGPEKAPVAVVIPSRFGTLAPGQRWRTMWDWGPARAVHSVLADENSVTLTFEYVGIDGKVQTNVSYLDWSEINARTYAVKKSVHHVAKEMAKIREILEKRAAPLRRREQGTGPEPTRQEPGVLARIYERLTGGLGQESHPGRHPSPLRAAQIS